MLIDKGVSEENIAGATKTEIVEFKYDGIFIACWLLKNYAEKCEHLTETKAERLAMYDIVNNLTNEYTEKILLEWANKHSIEEINFRKGKYEKRF